MSFLRMKKVVLKSLFEKPATKMYPVVPREFTPVTRGHVEMEDPENCLACGICAKRCPADAITVDKAKGVWVIHRMQCIQCNSCVETCPKQVLGMHAEYTTPNAEKQVDTYMLHQTDPKVAQVGDFDPQMETSEDLGLVCDKDSCVFCGLCARNCPADAITVDRAAKSWEVDKEQCLKCGMCIEKCPKKCLTF